MREQSGFKRCKKDIIINPGNYLQIDKTETPDSGAYYV